ncbi:MAG: hypothetical protein WC728_01890 [Elusimicrobiota bacterium]
MTDEARRPKPRFNWFYILFPLILFWVIILSIRHVNRPSPAEAPPADNVFNLDKAPVEDPKDQPAAYVSRFEKELEARQMRPGEAGLAGLVPENRGEAKSKPDASQVSGLDPAEAERERQLLAKYRDVLIRQDKAIFNMTHGYYKKYALVREVNAYFGRKNMPRYMALIDQYTKDRNPFALWRGAVALPEFREGVKKYIRNPDALRLGLRMLADGLELKPPKPLLDEGIRFSTHDNDVSRFMGKDFMPEILPRLPQALMDPQISEDSRRTIRDLAGQVAGPAAGAPNLLPSAQK